MLNLKDFIDKINNQELNTEEYRFYMISECEKYEIEPVYNSYNYLDEIILKDDDSIYSHFTLTEIVYADYLIEENK